MQYQCKICGAKLQGTEAECPDCHTPMGSATRVAGSEEEHFASFDELKAKPIVESSVRTSVSAAKLCPRCGEMLMSGANVCEVCGEVITPYRHEIALPQADTSEKVTAVSAVSEKMSVPAQTRVEVPTADSKEKHSQVSVNMLVIISVLTALIAGLIIWVIFYFNRKSADRESDEIYTESIADAPPMADNASVAEQQEVRAIEHGTAPAPATAVKTSEYDGVNDVPIEGMRESLSGSWMFYGKINNRYSIGIDLKIEPDGTVSGSYWYESTLRQNGDVPSTYITLEGEVDDTGRVKMTAFNKDRPFEYWTGHFSGVTPLVLKGTFRNASTGTTYTFATATR